MYSIILLLLRVSTSDSMILRPYFQSTVYTFVLSSCIKEDSDTFTPVVGSLFDYPTVVVPGSRQEHLP